MKEVITINGLVSKVSFLGKLIKETIQDDLNVIIKDFELEDGEAQIVEDKDSITLMINLKK